MPLLDIGAQAQLRQLPKEKCFHFTIFDHKPAVIARDLLLLLKLDGLASAKSMEDMITSGLFNLLYYTYLSPVMPRNLYLLL